MAIAHPEPDTERQRYTDFDPDCFLNAVVKPEPESDSNYYVNALRDTHDYSIPGRVSKWHWDWYVVPNSEQKCNFHFINQSVAKSAAHHQPDGDALADGESDIICHRY